MQIYALDEKGNSLQAQEGRRTQNYLCLECNQTLRVRGGQWRRLHFYHLTPSPACRLNGKSLTHLQVQFAIQKKLSPEEVFLERRFPAIGRIADVAWPNKKIVFEIQCSPISAEEVEARNRDFSTIGYSVVWILHDRRFNRFHLSSAESFLRSFPHYFTNINAFGKGIFYDQFAWVKGKRRIQKTPCMPIHVKRLTFLTSKQMASQLSKERKKWPLAFEGDLFHRGRLEKISKQKRSFFKLRLPYKALLHVLLEKTSDF